MRYCRAKYVADGRPTGDAFMLRPGAETREPEEFLSVLWLEHAAGNTADERLAAARDWLDRVLRLRAKDTLAVAQVERLKQAAMACRPVSRQLKILHWPNQGSRDPHSGIFNTNHTLERAAKLAVAEALAEAADEVHPACSPCQD